MEEEEVNAFQENTPAAEGDENATAPAEGEKTEEQQQQVEHSSGTEVHKEEDTGASEALPAVKEETQEDVDGADKAKTGSKEEVGEATATPVPAEEAKGHKPDEIPMVMVSTEDDDDNPEMLLRRGSSDSATKITGDFQYRPPSIFGSEHSMSMGESTEHKEEELVEEEALSFETEEGFEEEEEVERESLYEQYLTLLMEYNPAKRKNMFLMRKMAEYYKKRRMDHVLREGDNYEENLQKYYMKLDAFGELRDLEGRERTNITAEINAMKDKRNQESAQLKNNFEAMQARERHIGLGLIFVKTGKQIPDKVVERYLKTQRQKTEELCKLRVTYILMRDKIQEKQGILDDLDKIGDNFHLMDYEQLKIENRNHNDKIEERDDELSRLREKCIAAIDCLAHIREKSAEVQMQITEHTQLLEEAEMETWECRERVNYFKLERDNIRYEIECLKESSGLLTKDKLLCDMEFTQNDLTRLKKDLEKIIEEYNATKALVQQIKIYLEDIENKVKYFGPIQQKTKNKSESGHTSKRIYKDPIEYSHIKFTH